MPHEYAAAATNGAPIAKVRSLNYATAFLSYLSFG